MAEQTVFFAGGGTGGHIFPSLAVVQRLRMQQGKSLRSHLLISDRPLDREILQKQDVAYTALGVRPWSNRIWKWPGFLRAFWASVKQTGSLMREQRAAAVVAMGGFVSAPALVAGKRLGVPCALVSLDAVPGLANRRLASQADVVFSVYPVGSGALRSAKRIGLPIREEALARNMTPEAARLELGLEPGRETLLVVGGSQGAQSINEMMMRMILREDFRVAASGWQILHICGEKDLRAMREGYRRSALCSAAVGFCDRMGLAWRAASLAISRCGAGSVAEVWANATPAIFLPYPYHKDEHQKLNAQPLVDAAGSVLVRDLIEADANAFALAPTLLELMSQRDRRQAMSQALAQSCPGDGAAALCEWVVSAAG